jgi:high-affinity nickel-transport protein
MTAMTERFTPSAPLHGHEHEHRHAHDDRDEHAHGHAHLHGHGTDPHLGGPAGVVATFGWYQLMRPVAVGLVHGLAGSAAVALLVLATIQDTGTALVYLVIFCLGVAAGMAVLTTVIGLPFWVARARSNQINRLLTVGSGLLSLAFGLYLAYQIGFVDGLFTGNFNWEPA